MVSLPTALGMGPAVTLSMLGLGVAESALSAPAAAGGRNGSGGTADDRRTAGRAVALAAFAGLGWAGLRWVNGKLTTAGESLELAHAAATGGRGGDRRSRFDHRLGRPVPGEPALAVDGAAPAGHRARAWASRRGNRSGSTRPWNRPHCGASGPNNCSRRSTARKALERSVFALFSPTGSGYVNYVATETLEYLTRGDCASAAIQYSVLPSALSLGKVHLATAQTRIVVNGIVQRLLAMPAERRPQVLPVRREPRFAGQPGDVRGAGAFRPGRYRAGRGGVDRHPGGDGRGGPRSPSRTSPATPVVQDGVFVTRGIRDWAGLSDADRRSGAIPVAAER